MAPEALRSPNYHTAPMGGHFSSQQILACIGYPTRQVFSGTGLKLVTLQPQWPECYEFEPRTAEDQPCGEGGCTLRNVSRLKRILVGVVWKIGERGCHLECHARHLIVAQKMTKTVTNSPRVAEQ
ncbi:hypothetical protein TNCV_2618801 [Trichonephila clavipes]|nr:hypothetical protein TNCV_2618801 [Trichonephila clavipes]